MTMVEEDRLRTLLRQAADGFDVPDEAEGAILDAAAGLDARGSALQRAMPHARAPDRARAGPGRSPMRSARSPMNRR